MSGKVLVVVPCFNEASRFDSAAFADFLAAEPEVSVLLVNDGSSDGTAAALEALVALRPKQAFCLHLPENVGKAEAVRRGFVKGFGLRPEFIGYFDADLAAPLSCVPELLRLLETSGREVAIGARVKLLGRKIERNMARHFLGRVFATAASCALDLPVYDTQCGAKLFRTTPLLEKVFSCPFSSRWIFDVEILARMIIARGLAGQTGTLEDIAVELPLMEWIDRKGSKVKPGDFCVSFLDLARIFFVLRVFRFDKRRKNEH